MYGAGRHRPGIGRWPGARAEAAGRNPAGPNQRPPTAAGRDAGHDKQATPSRGKTSGGGQGGCGRGGRQEEHDPERACAPRQDQSAKRAGAAELYGRAAGRRAERGLFRRGQLGQQPASGDRSGDGSRLRRSSQVHQRPSRPRRARLHGAGRLQRQHARAVHPDRGARHGHLSRFGLLRDLGRPVPRADARRLTGAGHPAPGLRADEYGHRSRGGESDDRGQHHRPEAAALPRPGHHRAGQQAGARQVHQ